MDFLDAHRFIEDATRWATRPGLTEDEFVTRALAYANSADIENLAPLVNALNVPDMPPAHFGRGVVIEKRALDFNYEQAHADLRKGLRDILARKISKSHLTALAASAAQMLMIPERKIEQGRLSVSYRYITWNLWSGLAYALLLLLDDSRSYGARLCRCQLDSCGRFFLAHPPKAGTGKWIRAYHARDCFESAQKRKTAERVRRFREARKIRRRSAGARLRRL